MACWHTCLPTPWPTLFPQKPAPLVHSQCACTHRHRALCHQGSRDAPEESEGCTHQARSGRMPIAEPLCLPQQSISSSKVERQKKKKNQLGNLQKKKAGNLLLLNPYNQPCSLLRPVMLLKSPLLLCIRGGWKGGTLSEEGVTGGEASRGNR